MPPKGTVNSKTLLATRKQLAAAEAATTPGSNARKTAMAKYSVRKPPGGTVRPSSTGRHLRAKLLAKENLQEDIDEDAVVAHFDDGAKPKLGLGRVVGSRVATARRAVLGTPATAPANGRRQNTAAKLARRKRNGDPADESTMSVIAGEQVLRVLGRTAAGTPILSEYARRNVFHLETLVAEGVTEVADLPVWSKPDPENPHYPQPLTLRDVANGFASTQDRDTQTESQLASLKQRVAEPPEAGRVDPADMLNNSGAAAQ